MSLLVPTCLLPLRLVQLPQAVILVSICRIVARKFGVCPFWGVARRPAVVPKLHVELGNQGRLHTRMGQVPHFLESSLFAIFLFTHQRLSTSCWHVRCTTLV